MQTNVLHLKFLHQYHRLLCINVSRSFLRNYEKHALRVSQVIAAVAKVSCKHGLWLVDRVNKKDASSPVSPEKDSACGISQIKPVCSSQAQPI